MLRSAALLGNAWSLANTKGRFNMTCLWRVFCPSNPRGGNARAAQMGGAYRATLGPRA